MELRLEPKNSRAPNPYGSFPWMLGKNNLLQNLFYFLLFCNVGPGAVMCGRNPGDFIDITITSCPPEVRCCLIITINITLCYRCTPATLVPALPWPTSATPRSSAWTSRTRPTANILRCCRQNFSFTSQLSIKSLALGFPNSNIIRYLPSMRVN